MGQASLARRRVKESGSQVEWERRVCEMKQMCEWAMGNEGEAREMWGGAEEQQQGSAGAVRVKEQGVGCEV